MRRRPALALFAFLAALAAAPPALAAIPPPQRPLSAAEDSRLAALQRRAEAAESAENWAEVERVGRQMLALEEPAFGPDHPVTAAALSLVAYALERRGRMAEAEPLHRRGLAIYRAALGDRHEDTILNIRNLAANLDAQGRRADSEPLYRAALEALRVTLGERDRRVAFAAYELGRNLEAQGRHAEAEPSYRLALGAAQAAGGERNADTAASYLNLASNLGHQGRYAEGEPLLRKAVEINIGMHGERNAATAQAFANLAVNLSEQGRFDQAEPMLRKALEVRLATLGERHADTASSYHNLAANLQSQERYGEAEPMMRQALAIRRALLGDRDPDVAGSVNNLASLLSDQGKHAEAEPLLRESTAILERTLGPNHPLTAASYANLAANLSALKKRSEAEALYGKAIAIGTATQGERHPHALSEYNNLALLLNEDGRLAEAEQRAAKAVGIARFLRRRERERSGLATTAGDGVTTGFVFANYLDIAFDAGAAEAAALPRLRAEAFTAAQDLGASTTGRAMARAAARVAAGQAGLAETVRRQQDLAARAEVADGRLLAALSAGDQAAAAALRAELERDVAELDRLDREIRTKFPPYAELISPEAVSVAEAQRRLKPDEAVLLVRPVGAQMHVFAVSKTAVAWRRAPELAKTTAGAVRTLRCQVDPATCPAGTPPAADLAFDRALAHGLYRDLVQPVEGALTGVKTLYVIAHGPLSALPFGLLLTAPPAGPDTVQSLAGAPWLADRYALVTLPSVSSLRVLALTGARGSRPFAGFGDPVLGRPPAPGAAPRSPAKRSALTVFRGASEDGAALADPEVLRVGLEPLPGAGPELEAMARTLRAPPSALHVGSAATEAAVKGSADLRQARVVVFATHGLLPRELKGVDEPGLVFTPPTTATALDDGMLTASEAARLSLAADWVILSACNTASADGGPGGETLSGLAKAFLYAGANALLVSHWRVIDEVTSVLTVQTMAIQAADPALSKAQALQAAMRAVRTGKLPGGGALPGWSPEWAHPAAWAPFILVTAGE